MTNKMLTKKQFENVLKKICRRKESITIGVMVSYQQLHMIEVFLKSRRIDYSIERAK